MSTWDDRNSSWIKFFTYWYFHLDLLNNLEHITNFWRGHIYNPGDFHNSPCIICRYIFSDSLQGLICFFKHKLAGSHPILLLCAVHWTDAGTKQQEFCLTNCQDVPECHARCPRMLCRRFYCKGSCSVVAFVYLCWHAVLHSFDKRHAVTEI